MGENAFLVSQQKTEAVHVRANTNVMNIPTPPLPSISKTCSQDVYITIKFEKCNEY